MRAEKRSLPDDPMAEQTSKIKLFDKWDLSEVEVHDVGLKRYICLEDMLVPKSKGRHAKKQFYKGDVNIVERLLNKMYVAGHRGKKHKITSGHNVGKSDKLLGIIKQAFNLIEDEEDENPVQVLVTAIENSAPTEEVVTYQKGGIMARKAVIISPQRRVDLALRMITQGAYENRTAESKNAEQALAEGIIKAYNEESCKAIRERKRREREADGAR